MASRCSMHRRWHAIMDEQQTLWARCGSFSVTRARAADGRHWQVQDGLGTSTTSKLSVIRLVSI